MRQIKLLFGVHNHQPLGNFHHVFEYAYERAYRPLIETVNDYPEFRITYHFSGPLLSFLQKNHPEIIESVKNQVKRGQAEIIAGGFYEPVLAMLPKHDRIHQINMAKEFIRENFGFEADGLWLTERVFESEILFELRETGIKYFLLDDAAFTQVGIPKENLHGYFLHPVGNDYIRVFPIDETLRYLIPFRPVEEVINYFKHILSEGGKAAIFFDDGEKFGLWPGTYKWVFDEGWLRNFIESCLKADFIETQLFGEYLKEFEHEGVVFLPSSSYFEMGEWSLFSQAAYQYTTLFHRFKNAEFWEELKPFFRGGIWRNFLNKYIESGRMYRRMLWLSREVNKIKPNKDLLESLLRSQCNDPYWHGVFGGIYLPHLRQETYKNLITATENLLKHTEKKFIAVSDFDFNMDGRPDFAFFSRSWSFVVDPHKGTLVELSYMPIKYNFQNTLTRYREHYHRFWQSRSHQVDESTSGVPSIHELNKHIPESIQREMYFDTYIRESFIDRILPEDTGLVALKTCEFDDTLTGFKPFYTMGETEGCLLKMETTLNGEQFSIKKLFKVNGETFSAKYCVEGTIGEDKAFVLELNFIMPSATNGEVIVDGRKWEFDEPIDYRTKLEGALEFHDNSGIVFLIKPGTIKRFVIFPFYTVSQSESGMELIYQGHSVFLFYAMEDQALDFEVSINIKEENNA